MSSGPIPFPDREACLQYARGHYGVFRTRCDNSFLAQTLDTADLADSLLTNLFVYTVGAVLPQKRLIVDSAYCAALLFPVLQVEPHACFETLMERANLETARIVSEITPDRRLVGPKRHRELLGRLYDADLASQVVMFCQLRVQITEVLAELAKLADPKARRGARAAHRDWLVLQGELLAALRIVRDEESLAVPWANLYDELSSLLKHKEPSDELEKIKANIARRHAAAAGHSS